MTSPVRKCRRKEKTGSCLMGRKEFCKSKEIDIEADTLTLEKFIELTINAYGGDIIAKIRERIR